MARGMVLTLLVVISLSAMTVAYQVRQPEGIAIPAISKVADNLYVIGGSEYRNPPVFTGGNTAAFITSTGVVLVDTKNPGWGRMMLDKVRTVTDKPVTTVINTHSHGDHSGSNGEFPATVEFVAHENTRANLAKPQCRPSQQPDGGCQSGAPQKYVAGMKTFRDKMSLFSGKDRIDLYYFGRAHTGGDTVVVFPAARAMHTGDLFALTNIINMDGSSGGSGRLYPRTIAKAVAALRGKVDAGRSPFGAGKPHGCNRWRLSRRASRFACWMQAWPALTASRSRKSACGAC